MAEASDEFRTDEGGQLHPEVRQWRAKRSIRNVLFGGYFGLLMGVLIGYRLGLVFPERFPGVWFIFGILGLSMAVNLALRLVRPSSHEIAARAAWWSRRISPRTARVLKIMGLPLVGLSFTCMLLCWAFSSPDLRVAFCLLGVGVLVLLPAAFAEKPRGVSADDWERLRNAE